MAKNWDAEMQERFEKLAETVGAFGKQFATVDKRFDGVDQRFDGVDKRFDGVDRRLDGVDRRLDGVDKRLDGVDKRLDGIDKRLDNMASEMNAREERILNAVKMEGENTREAIQKAAEGYGATLESIERTLDETRREWHAKWTVHDHALQNHAGRITVLERAKKR